MLDPHNHRSIGALLNAIAYYYFGIIKSLWCLTYASSINYNYMKRRMERRMGKVSNEIQLFRNNIWNDISLYVL